MTGEAEAIKDRFRVRGVRLGVSSAFGDEMFSRDLLVAAISGNAIAHRQLQESAT